jgi:hypothetical protein
VVSCQTTFALNCSGKANHTQLCIVLSSRIWIPIMLWTVELEKIEFGSS